MGDEETITVGGKRYAVRPQTLELITGMTEQEIAVTKTAAALDRLDTRMAAEHGRLREMAETGEVDDDELEAIEARIIDLNGQRQEATRANHRARLALVAARLNGHDLDELVSGLDLRDLADMERQLATRPT